MRVESHFYGLDLEKGCAFEELISLQGAPGGPQTGQFLVHLVAFPLFDDAIVAVEGVHGLLTGWRQSLQRGERTEAPASR